MSDNPNSAIVANSKNSVHCVSDVCHDLPYKKIIVHPLVLLSVVDHFNRVSKSQTVKRVIGVLLGNVNANKSLDIANSFGVPFDEDARDKSIYFLDMDYLENMYAMFYKVAAKEKIVGWYHTGPKLCTNDVHINDLLKKFTPNPVLVVIQASSGDPALPTKAYIEVQEVHDDGTPPIKTFEHLPSEISAEEAEEVGVEHLLRDIKNQTAGTLSERITNQLLGLSGLVDRLTNIKRYLKKVSVGELPTNHAIIYNVQEILNLLPDVTLNDFVGAQNIEANNQFVCIYLGSLVRSIISFNNLIDNKKSVLETEKKREELKDESKDLKPKDTVSLDSIEAKKRKGTNKHKTSQRIKFAMS